MKPFQGVDYYQTGDLLSVEERNVRDTIRRWVENEYIPKVGTYFDEAAFEPGLARGEKVGCFGMTASANSIDTPQERPDLPFGNEEGCR